MDSGTTAIVTPALQYDHASAGSFTTATAGSLNESSPPGRTPRELPDRAECSETVRTASFERAPARFR